MTKPPAPLPIDAVLPELIAAVAQTGRPQTALSLARNEASRLEIERSFESHYRMPAPYPRTDVISFAAGYADQDTDTARSQTALVYSVPSPQS